MKLKIHSMLRSLTIVAIISIFSFPAWGTDVGGIIDEDTIWDFAGSPYNITETVQIDEGVTLTIDPGVTVNGKNAHWIQVWGTIEAIGSSTERIEFNRVEIASRSPDTLLHIEFSSFISGFLDSQSGSLLLKDSIIQGMGDLWVRYSSSDCQIYRNIFVGLYGLLINQNNNADVYIRNNVFVGSGKIFVYHAGNGRVVVENNSFLFTDSLAAKLDTNPDANMTAVSNFWNTKDPAVIESMIYDRNDDLNVYNYIDYLPILEGPHKDTPSLDFVLANLTASPTSGDYPLTVSFTDQSFGTIVTRVWDFGDGTGNAQQNPTHTYTEAGTYTVTLTITGDDGTDTKTKTNYITVNEPAEPPPPPPDTDGDKVIDPEDNCINEYNPGQEDSDSDNIGDACDIDQLQQQIDVMSSQVDSLTDQNETLQAQMTNLLEAYGDMEQRIQALEEGYSDHSHSYLTGKGGGQNNVRALSGPAVYPASPEPNP